MDNTQNKLSVPVAIVAAGIIIAGAVFFSKGAPTTPSANNAANASGAPAASLAGNINLAPVAEKDHILGNPDASIVLVEYSDLECPACKYFDSVLQQMMGDYGKSGQVAWVFRHFPIKELHSKSPREAEASECVNELGGNQKFWAFINKLYEVTPANNGLDPAQLPVIAAGVGADKDKFNSCLNSGKYTALVSADYNTGVAAGVQGTPTSFLVLKKPLSQTGIQNLQTKTAAYKSQGGELLVNISGDGKIVKIGAAFPYQALKEILDAVLAEMK
jgi:protein-disulfide isomerase